MKRRMTSLLALAALVLGLALPAPAITDNSYIAYQGSYCDWDGYNEHLVDGSYSRGVGTTGIQTGYSASCNQSRVKVRWITTTGSYYQTSVFYGGVGATSGTIYNMGELAWTDHDVFVTYTNAWHGFRNYH